jgi:hypothetical protein
LCWQHLHAYLLSDAAVGAVVAQPLRKLMPVMMRIPEREQKPLEAECQQWVLELVWVQAVVCLECQVCPECRGCPEWLAVPALQLQLLWLRQCFLHAPQLSSKK